jgi:hypothetical protein
MAHRKSRAEHSSINKHTAPKRHSRRTKFHISSCIPRPKQSLDCHYYAILSLFLRRGLETKKHLIVHREDYSLASSFAIFLLFCPLLAFMHLFHSGPSSLSPKMQKSPKKRPAIEREKKSTKTTLRGISTRTYKNRRKRQRQEQEKSRVVKGG